MASKAAKLLNDSIIQSFRKWRKDKWKGVKFAEMRWKAE